MSEKEKEYSIVVLGATGYTGSLIASYLATKKDIRWAIAGRSEEKLKQIKTEIESSIGKEYDIPILIASTSDLKSLQRITEKASILINAVGPFYHEGENVVKACIKNKCHYLDISGEPDYFRTLIKKYHQLAVENQVIIVSGCGLDSVPWDLGVLYATHGSSQRNFSNIVSVQAYAKLKINPSVGTISSALLALSTANLRSVYDLLDDWFDLKSSSSAKGFLSKILYRIPRIPFWPHYCSQLKQWAVPVPGTVDVSIVRRSARLNYSKDSTNPRSYHFGQYFVFRTLFQLLSTILIVLMLIPWLAIISKIKPLREGLIRSLRSSVGDGPSTEARKSSSLKCYVFAKDSIGQTIGTAKVICAKDPGYESTAKWISETAICLLENKNLKQGGVLTTASCDALGFKLIEKLQKANLTFEYFKPE